MINKRYFLLGIMLAFVGLVGMSCSAPGITDTPVTSIASPATEINIAPSITLSPTPLPTLSFTILGTQYPTATPYPTANTVKANAIAFIEQIGIDDSLWVANIDGSGERKLVDIERNAEWVSHNLLQWSPDGKWISYISGDDLWLISPDGSMKRRILSIQDTSQKIVMQFSWSPDSSKLAYALAANWGDFSEITTGLFDLPTGKNFELSVYQSGPTITLSWSPNGRYILLNTDTSLKIFEVANKKVLKEINNNCPIWHGQPSWSPNGDWFFRFDYGIGYYNIWICISSLNGTTWRMEDVGATISPPAWDKTGKYLYLVVGEMDLDRGPNWCKNQRLVRYDVETHKIQTLLSLKEDGPTGFPWFVYISPNGRTLGLYTYTHYEDLSHPGHVYVDSSRPKQNRFIILDIQSMSATKFTLEVEGEINGSFPPLTWSADSQKIIFFLRNLVRQSFGISFSDFGSFYSLDIKTGKVELFSGVHAVENAIISPIAISPLNNE